MTADPDLPSLRAPGRAPGGLLVVNGLCFLAAWFLWNYPVMYPLKLLVVLMHESGHALACVLTGGTVQSIQISPNEAGVTYTAGGSRILILSAGYLGSTALGLTIFYLSHLRTTAKHVMEAMGVAILAVAIWKVREPFTLAFCCLTGAAFLFIGVKGWLALEVHVARFIGISSTLYAVLDIRDDLLHWGKPVGLVFVGDVAKSDAQALADILVLPAVFWGALWAAISVLALLWVLAAIARLPAARLVDTG